MLMLVGIGLVGVLTATVASYFVEQRDDSRDADVNRRLDRIEHMIEELLVAGRVRQARDDDSSS